MSDHDIDIDRLLERIQERLDVLELSERKASLIATGRPDAIRYIRTRRSKPSMGRVMKLAAALETSASYLIGSKAESDEEPQVSSVIRTMSNEAVEELESLARQKSDTTPFVIWEVSPADYSLFDTPTRDKKAVNLYRFGPTITGIMKLPEILHGTNVVGFKMPDSSMHPVFDPGEMIFAQRNVSINYKDDLVLGISESDDTPSGKFLIGRLVTKIKEELEIRQFGSNSSFRVPINRVEILYRILRVTDLMGKPKNTALIPQPD